MNRVSKLFDRIALRSSHRLLVLSFFPLHFSIWDHKNPALSKTLFLLHIGLFLIWQPFVNHRTQIQTRPTIILILAILGIIYMGGGWAQTIWIVFLVGILSSYRLEALSEKLIFLLLIVYLLIELFAGLIPFNTKADSRLFSDTAYIEYSTLILCTLAFLAPARITSFRNYNSDVLYSIISISIVILVAMTTLIWMSYGIDDYYLALVFSLMTLAGTIIAFNLVFHSSSEIGLLAQLRDRYLLNLGTPFESFLLETAQISESTGDPEEYLEKAFDNLCKLEWINGFDWKSGGNRGDAGELKGQAYLSQFEELEVRLYSTHELGPAMATHSRLLIKLIEIFYAAKCRELAISRSSHMEAIYETGARLTHDIKNLLQSLNLMLAAANSRSVQEHDSRLFFKNLEIISQRLQQTLMKLRNPETLSGQSVSIHKWWNDVKQREASNDYIFFNEKITDGIEIPEELFNSVIDNLLDNAKKKHKREPELTIQVGLKCTLDELELQVRDSGSPVPEAVVKTLLHGPVKSRSGFGIGLYQASKQATAHGYTLALIGNDENNVVFKLSRN
ncbi:MAG TPA: ATP-binding protein [Gammaproteobacteria bacterium]|nr:ATP-binding protein [Gammaproteobacteria bacterium]